MYCNTLSKRFGLQSYGPFCGGLQEDKHVLQFLDVSAARVGRELTEVSYSELRLGYIRRDVLLYAYCCPVFCGFFCTGWDIVPVV